MNWSRLIVWTLMAAFSLSCWALLIIWIAGHVTG